MEDAGGDDTDDWDDDGDEVLGSPQEVGSDDVFSCLGQQRFHICAECIIKYCMGRCTEGGRGCVSRAMPSCSMKARSGTPRKMTLMGVNCARYI